MIVSYIDIVGFRSITTRTKLKLNSKGVNIITGANGSGKSQIWNALSWCWFAKTLNEATDIETYKEIRQEPYLGIRVETCIYKNKIKYQIIKTKNFKGFDGKDKRHTGIEILIDGEPKEGLRDANDYKKEIQNIIGISFRLFHNSIMFGQKLKRIIEESGGEQKDLFTEAFEVDFIKLARKKIEDRRTWINSDLEPLSKKMELATVKYSIYKSQLVQEKTNERNFNNSKDERLTIINFKIQTTESEIESLRAKAVYDKPDIILLKIKNLKNKIGEDKTKELIDLNSTLNSNNNLLYNERASRGRILKEMEDMVKVFDVCQTCGQKLSTGKITELRKKLNKNIELREAKLSEIKDCIKERKKVISSLQEQISSISKEIEQGKSYIDKIKKLEEYLYNAQTIENNLYNKETRLMELEQEKSEIKNLAFSYETKWELKRKVKRYALRKSIFANKIEPLKKELSMVEWAIKDPLSNKGLSTYIFDSMLKNLNNRLRFYSALVGFDISFKIRIESARKDFYVEVYHRGILKNYKNLSGGEAQLTNIAIAFAIHDVINETKDLNILILDEAFESLDEVNVEIVCNMIEMKARGKSLWLITHLRNLEITNAIKYNISFSNDTGTVIEYL